VDLDAEAQRRGKRLRILVTRLRYLGDVILTTPAVEALKGRYPGAEIFYAAERPYADILEGNPHLAGVIGLRRGGRHALEACFRLRGLDCTAAIDLFYNPRSALLLYLSGIPVRAGGARRFRRRFYTHVFTIPGGTRSAVMHHLEAMRVFDVEPKDSLPRVYLSTGEMAAGRAFLESMLGIALPGRRILAMHPGGTWPSKRWSQESFATLARSARERLDAEIIVLTGPGEDGIAGAVEERSGGAVHVLALQPLRRLASILASCSALVANDGGILHMGVALGRPTVGIFGPTEPDIWFPYAGKGPFALVTHTAECAPCHRHECESMECLVGIEPKEVLERIEEVLAWER
jgi:heptosyltransferase-3